MKAKLVRAAIVSAAAAVVACVAGGAWGASLFELSTQRSLIGDSKARAVGDLVTIIIKESATASADTTAERKKDTTTNAGITNLFYPSSGTVTHDGENPSFKWTGTRTSKGSGKSDSSSDFETKVTARVIDVQPNGNLLIEATRQIEIGGSPQKVVLTGIVRPDDIAADNTVESTYIADAKITYEGPMAEVTRRGLLERLMDWINIF